MSSIRVFSGQLSNGITNTAQIFDASGIYITYPDSNSEVELDIFLQIEVSRLENRQIRLDDGITLIDSETLIRIPEEYRLLSNRKYLSILNPVDNTGFAFTGIIEVWAVYPDSCSCQVKLDEISTKQDLLLAQAVAVAINQLGQNASLLTLGAGLGAGLAVLTGGSSLALPAAIGSQLTPGTTAINALPLLLSGV